ncbi:hypothetical protein AGMMS50268_05490 [Spirochaetia bacterium]|nr:hypothetical protein AGMMS50268_05490 [Spirochaetia bacterium]
MKKLFLAVLFVCASLHLFAQDTTLLRLAVVEFSTNISNDKIKADAITVRNLVESQMIGTGKYQIITHDEIDKLLANQSIAVSSISSTENVKKLQLQNISYIVTGSVDLIGNDYAVVIKILDVSTGEFSHSANDFVTSSPQEFYAGVNKLVGSFVSGMASGGGTVLAKGEPVVPNTAVYKIGDRGPAGGIVFYDKGAFSGGWRYLEAAPVETEFTAPWGAFGKDISGTVTAVGGGKKNTQELVEQLERNGETETAAQRGQRISFDGFSDWFLPSKDELDLMYKNLKANGLDGFGTERYWSSSQDDKNRAWGQDFRDGKQDYYSKNRSYSVRVIRAF